MCFATNIFYKYKNEYFVETGSYLGDGIQAAIDSGFENIISIELSEKYRDICIEKFKEFKNVKIVFGDSAFILYKSIKDIDNPITFWLDGHHSCGDTALGEYWSPLMKELEQIGEHPVKTHTIIIDDMRCWNEDNPVIGFGEEMIKKEILKINSNYTFSFEDGYVSNDILVAKVE